MEPLFFSKEWLFVCQAFSLAAQDLTDSNLGTPINDDLGVSWRISSFGSNPNPQILICFNLDHRSPTITSSCKRGSISPLTYLSIYLSILNLLPPVYKRTSGLPILTVMTTRGWQLIIHWLRLDGDAPQVNEETVMGFNPSVPWRMETTCETELNG